jgi:hypothetical protein
MFNQERRNVWNITLRDAYYMPIPARIRIICRIARGSRYLHIPEID